MDFLKTFSMAILAMMIAIGVGMFTDLAVTGVFVFLVAVSSLGTLVRYFFTQFIVDNHTIETRFHFLSNRHTSFTIDKISSITMHESLIDRLFGTCSMVFRSIGSATGSALVFVNIKKTPTLERDLLEKVGIYRDQSPSEVLPVHFSIPEYLKANIKVFIPIAIVFVGLCVGMIV